MTTALPSLSPERAFAIAKEHFFVKTLEIRNSDSLDFYDVGVGCIKSGIEAAFKEGVLAQAKAAALSADQARERLVAARLARGITVPPSDWEVELLVTVSRGE